MRATIMPGSVLLQADALLPEGVKIDSEPFVPGWRFVKNMNAYGLDRAVREVRWNYFCLAEDINVIVIGTRESSRIKRGINNLVAQASADNFNSLEITQVSAKSFLGVPYVRMSARPRHVQESMVLVRHKPVPVWEMKKDDNTLNPVAGFI